MTPPMLKVLVSRIFFMPWVRYSSIKFVVKSSVSSRAVVLDRTASLSMSVILTEVLPSAAPVALLKPRVKVSTPSSVVSLVSGTVIDPLSEPVAMDKVPLVAVKSLLDAVSLAVA